MRKAMLILGIIFIWMAVLLMCAGCNPVKRVLKSQAKTEKVLAEWRKANPLDTTTTDLVKGRDTLYSTRIVRDSVKTPFPVNHRFTEIHYKESFRVDTLRITTQDTAMIGLLLRKIQGLEKLIMEQDAKIKELRGFKAGVIFLACLVVVIGAIALLKKFKIF